jgi:hypothetical protein
MKREHMTHLNRMKLRVATGVAVALAAAGVGLAGALTPASAQPAADTGHHHRHAVIEHLLLESMPEGIVATDAGAVRVLAFGFTPGSSHSVVLTAPSGATQTIGTLTASGTGRASATFMATVNGGARLEILDGGAGTATIATAPVDKESFRLLKAVEPGTPGLLSGFATLVYDPDADTLTITLTASGLSPGAHAAHIHAGSCVNQGPVRYMLTDFTADQFGIIDNEVRVVTGVTSAPPASGWYLNVHQGTSASILDANGKPTIFFRPLLCAGIGAGYGF